MSQIEIRDVRLLPGCSASMCEPSALVEIVRELTAGPDEESGGWARSQIPAAFPAELFVGTADTEWPDDFLVDRPSGGDPRDRRLGEWIVAVTVALQRLAGNPVGRGQVVEARPDRLLLAIPWSDESAFNDALALAVRLLGRWPNPVSDPQAMHASIGSFRQGRESGTAALPMLSLQFAQSALRKGIPVTVLPGFIQLGWGARAERLDRTYSGRTGVIAAGTAQSKLKTNQTLFAAGLPVPRGDVVADVGSAEDLAGHLGWPVVVKPVNLHHGIGVVPGISDVATLRRAFAAADALSPGAVIVESHVDGEDYRLLVVHGRVIAIVHRIPGRVIGDGVHTVSELVEKLNAGRAQLKAAAMLKPLILDAAADELLTEQGLNRLSVPSPGLRVLLRRVANTSAGGDSVAVTARAHPDNLRLAERAARLLGLGISGVDLLTPDIGRSWREAGGAICEVNAQPALHWLAEPDRDFAGEIIDAIFEGRPVRIPTVAIMGVTGAGAVALLLHRIWMEAGVFAGVCTSQTVRIGDEIVECGSLSLYRRARVVLTDPGMEVGIFELTADELHQSGYPCDRYDVAVVLNGSAADAGLLERTAETLVLDADDPLCLAMRSKAAVDRHILVSLEKASPSVAHHRAEGGGAVFTAERSGESCIVLAAGVSEAPLMPVSEIAAAGNRDAMFAAAVAWAQGIDTAVIRRVLAECKRPPAGRTEQER